MPGIAPKQKVRKGRVIPGFPNENPVVEIIAFNPTPFGGEGETPYRARAFDREQGDLSENIVWSTVADGVLGTGPNPTLNFTTGGVQDLFAAVTDSYGYSGEDDVSVNVGP